jgi:thymidylate kinase
MTFTVSITGIDGCGKSTSLAKIAEFYAKEYTVAKIGRPNYVYHDQKKTYRLQSINKLTDKAHEYSDNLESKLLVAGVNVLNGIVWSITNAYVQLKDQPNILFYGRDPVVDPAVYATFYMPFTKKWPVQTRLDIARLATLGRKSDVLIYMDVKPSLAIERIEHRIKEDNMYATERKKWKHMHENLQDLQMLHARFDEALRALSGHKRTKIHSVDANKPHDEVIKDMIRIINYEMFLKRI